MYNKGQLQITEPCSDGHDGDEPEYATTHYHVYGHFALFPYPVAYLPHSCDEWLIGGPEQIQALIDDLTQALKALSAHQANQTITELFHNRLTNRGKQALAQQAVEQLEAHEGEGK
jgi:hypothetical protein